MATSDVTGAAKAKARPRFPISFTPDKQQEFLQFLRIGGNTRECAIRLVGLSKDTLRRALASNDTFAEQVSQAEARSEALAVAELRAGGKAWTPKDANGNEIPALRRTTQKHLLRSVAVRDADGNPVRNPDGSVAMEEVLATVTEVTEEYRIYQPDWRASESYLKRRHTDVWSDRTEVTGADGETLAAPVVIVRGVSLDDL